MSEEKIPVVIIERVTQKDGKIERGDWNWVPVHSMYSDVEKAVNDKLMTLIDDEPDLMILITSKRMTQDEIDELESESEEEGGW